MVTRSVDLPLRRSGKDSVGELQALSVLGRSRMLFFRGRSMPATVGESVATRYLCSSHAKVGECEGKSLSVLARQAPTFPCTGGQKSNSVPRGQKSNFLFSFRFLGILIFSPTGGQKSNWYFSGRSGNATVGFCGGFARNFHGRRRKCKAS
jgi:hypothetical protein